MIIMDTMREINEVLSCARQWAVVQGDSLEICRQLDGAVDLCFGSPPYVDARLYLENGEGLGIDRNAEQWVVWLVDAFRVLTRACRGLTAMVVEGRTKNYRWDGAPSLLEADLIRAGFNLRHPAAYHRRGIAGSGGPDFLRNDHERIVCVTHPGRLSWSDNTAMGAPPKYRPGGAMSHRTVDGTRVNAKRKEGWGTRGYAKGDLVASKGYKPPENLADYALTLYGLRSMLNHYGNATKEDSGSVLQDLRRSIGSKEVSGWLRRVVAALSKKTVLQCLLHGQAEQEAARGLSLPGLREELPSGGSGSNLLLPGMPSAGAADSQGDGSPEANHGTHQPLSCQEEESEADVQPLRESVPPSCASHRQESVQQHPQQPGSPVYHLSRKTPPSEADVYSVWETAEGTRVLREALGTIQEAWRSITQENIQMASGTSSRGLANPGNVVFCDAEEASDFVSCIVGGGHMGHELAHGNEAPFPESLPDFFIRTFCPPGGVVLDPFSGSGTTVAAALKAGRRGIGIDLRSSQVELAYRRIADVIAQLEEDKRSLFS